MAANLPSAGCSRLPPVFAALFAMLSPFLSQPVSAGPVEFGQAEIERAITDRGLNPKRFRIRPEISAAEPETYRIIGTRVTGGDLRGLMYGLLTAAEQIRTQGRLLAARGQPATPIRGVRILIHSMDFKDDWPRSQEYWTGFLQMLARNRFNRFNLVFVHPSNRLAPPYPYWVAVEDFPEASVSRLSEEQRNRNLEMLCFISQTAADHAIDFTLGIREDNAQRRASPTVEGLTTDNIGPYSYAALKKVLASCPAIRSVQIQAGSGVPLDQQSELISDYIYPAIQEAGRLVKLDLGGSSIGEGMFEITASDSVPLRLSMPFTQPNGSGLPRNPEISSAPPYEFFWEITGHDSNHLLLWGDPDHVRRVAPALALEGWHGFEINAPLANRPGAWGIFTSARQDRVFWKHDYERYWFFYLLWGRLSYDPKTPETIWLAELERRFGDAASDVLATYINASRILPEISAIHAHYPYNRSSPEIDPGGPIESYIFARPVNQDHSSFNSQNSQNGIKNSPSARHTSADAIGNLPDFAQALEETLERAGAKLDPSHREWRGSEPDFRVLAGLARYHAHKRLAAEQLAFFYETSNRSALSSARMETASAVEVWEEIVVVTDGIFEPLMANSATGYSHWKDMLPYVGHDLEMIEEREALFDRFGQFEFGFDFGSRASPSQNLESNTVEPRFHAVSPASDYDEEKGYGWVSGGEREAVPLPPGAYTILRTTALNTLKLPQNTLFGDSIRGIGPQTFRVRTGGPGEYTVTLLSPDGKATVTLPHVWEGALDIVFPETEWNVSGIVIKSADMAQWAN